MKHVTWCAFAVLFCLAFFIVSCTDEEETVTPTPNNTAVADSLVNLANNALETVMINLIESMEQDSIQEPGDVDMTEPYSLFLEAIDQDAEHPTANFGAGILEIVMLTQDADVQDMFDRMMEMDQFMPFIIDSAEVTTLPGTQPLPQKGWTKLPLTAPKFLNSGVSLFDDDPVEYDEMRNLIINSFLPRLTTAISRLEITAYDADFIFSITPEMQGDENEDAIEIDHTDILAMLSGFYGIQAITNDMLAYNYDMGENTPDDLVEMLSQGSDFATLHDDGAQHLAETRTAWLYALDRLEAAINSLEAETDNQSNDLIRLDPYDGPSQADLDTAMTYIPKIRQTLNSQSTWVIDDETGDEITVSLYNYYTNPPQDLKAMLPGYTVSYQAGAWDTEEFDSYEEITVYGYDQDATGYWYCWAEWDDGELVGYYEDGYGLDPGPGTALWNELVSTYVIEENIYVGINIYINKSWTQTDEADAEVSVYWEQATSYIAVPVITWEADSYEEWTFPDPTFGGVFPDMTDARLKELWDMEAEDWEKTMVFDWSR